MSRMLLNKIIKLLKLTNNYLHKKIEKKRDIELIVFNLTSYRTEPTD